jgi:hypothetical protein
MSTMARHIPSTQFKRNVIPLNMANDGEDNWSPKLWGKQVDVFNCQQRIVLLSGPSLSGKTHIALHRIVRHLWETKGAQVAMFSKLLKNAKDGGTWKIMHKRIIPEWIAAGIGFRYTTKTAEGKPGAKVDGQTRTPYFRVTNAYGGESECMLFSLDFDDDIEDKIKEQEFSMIYFSELDKFRDRKVLSISLPRLRMSHLKYEEQMWLADTNPSDEGKESWIYKMWYAEPKMDYDTYVKYSNDNGLAPMSVAARAQLLNGLALFEFKPRENPMVDPRQLEELESAYAYDVGLKSRYVDGMWVYGDGDASRHFRTYFKKNIHVVGNCDSLDESEWLYVMPTAMCFSLVTGWDLGDTYHAVGVMEKTYQDNKAHFVLLDEVVSLKAQISNEAVTVAVMEKIEYLESLLARKFDLEASWSDRSSIEKYSASADTFPYLQVYAASGERIFLKGTPKASGSVRIRVQLMKMLLHTGRFKVSAHCTYAIRMLEDLKKGKTDFVVEDENKHIFDAITYALLMELSEELEKGPEVGERNKQAISVQV